MRIALSADMEGIAGITDARAVLASCPEYWAHGRAAYTADIVAAARGLLEGGADEVVVLDNHASGNPRNVLDEVLPDGVRVEDRNVFDLPALGIDGMLQVGYHPRANVAGFVPHTYVPGLEILVDGAPISESHGRIWAAGVPLLGITGHAAHERTLGALAGTPFLVVQDGDERLRARSRFSDPQEALTAIREFARTAMRGIADAPRFAAPAGVELVWRTGDREETVPLSRWTDAREPLAAAMGAAMAPFGEVLAGLDLSSEEAVARQDPAHVDAVTERFLSSLED